MINQIDNIDDLIIITNKFHLINTINRSCIKKCNIDLMKIYNEDIECLEICASNDTRYRLVYVQKA